MPSMGLRRRTSKLPGFADRLWLLKISLALVLLVGRNRAAASD